MKSTLIGIFITLLLILLIPALFLLIQQRRTSHPSASSQVQITPTLSPGLSSSRGQATIAGYIYHDTNQDGQRQAEEKPFANVKVQMKELKEGEETHQILDAQTDSYGYFTYHFSIDSQNSYMIKIVFPKGYTTANVNPLIISEMQPNTQKLVEFGLIPNGEFIPSPIKKITPSPTSTK